MTSRILFLSGQPSDAQRLSSMLQSLPMAIDYAANLREAQLRLQAIDYEVVLTEAALPDGDWLDALRLARGGSGDPALIVTDPQADARFWSQALNLGAYDLLAQPFYEPEVRRILSYACSRPQRRPAFMSAA
jgi:two-component system copper resistance phosphate regulon response regulator CusR